MCWAHSSFQSHPKAKPFRKKPFPLFDQIASLVDSVVATGMGAMHLAGGEDEGTGVGDSSGESSVASEGRAEGNSGREEVRSGGSLGDIQNISSSEEEVRDNILLYSGLLY